MIGGRIKKYREGKGLKVAAFAGIIGISQGSLSDIENGKTKPSAETLAKIVRNTDIDSMWLLTGEERGEEKAGKVVEAPPPYKGKPTVKDLIDQHLAQMDEEAQRDVLKYTEKTKLLAELLAERQGKRG